MSFAHRGPAGDEHLRPVRADFSTSVNAYGPAEAVVDAVRAATTPARLAAYPDPTCRAAREALAAHAGVGLEWVAVGAGAAELILAAALAFAHDVPGRGDARVLVPRHAFGEYARAAELAGARVVTLERAQSMAEAVAAVRPRLAFLCTPESPAGRAWSLGAVREVADACGAAGARLVLDQSFDAFTREPLGTPALRGHPAVLHLRSLTKDHALAGVRVGYVVGTAEPVAALDRVRMPWSVSTAAQAAAVAACTPAALAHARRTTALLRDAAAVLRATFAPACDVPSDVHYFLLRAGDDARAGARVARALRERHALRVRDCASFGLPAYVRIAARTPPENACFAAALADVLAHDRANLPHAPLRPPTVADL
ncbi:MAG TPA: aminotransferase class I/II-fold pyridoxal phosphate-dependent enzyme [Gemmatirosa sp.]